MMTARYVPEPELRDNRPDPTALLSPVDMRTATAPPELTRPLTLASPPT
jgi:hypothetical protein